MMDSLEPFKDSLGEVSQIANHAESLLIAKSGEQRDLANALTRSGLVLLCGYFEGYVRELLQEAVDRINESRLDVNLLPEQLFAGLVDSAFALSGVKRIEALSVLRTQIKERAPCVLNRQRLSITGGNPKVEVIDGLFETLGIPEIIDSLSVKDFELDSTYTEERQSKAIEIAVIEALGEGHERSAERVLALIDQKWLPKRRRRSVGYVSGIQELLKRRNRIAHGESKEIVTPQDLRDHAQLVEKLAMGLSEKVSEWLDKLLPRAPDVQF